MKLLLGALAKEGMLSIVVLGVLVALAWLGGEYMGWDPKLRILIIVGLLLAFLIMYVVQKLLAVKRAMTIENQLRAQAQVHVQSTIPDKQPEIQALETQFQEALAALKASGLGKDALYRLPWYPIIGPPGAGKSTALQESGLNFPSMGTGPRAIRGIGGTRNCDWWFTDEGILLDTAGRYTTEMDDQQEWFSFLDLLKRSRKNKPINGAIVAISIADIVSSNETQIEEYASTIRDRLDELSKRLELVFPVYLMFTKCDLLQGFVEFFEEFGKQERSQVWGTTLKYTSNPGRPYEEIFLEESQKLADNLRKRRIGALGTERPVKKKQNVFLFPLQFEMAQKKLAEFIGQLFRPNPFQESATLRGFYFTSGTQKGTPVDQVVAALSKAFGVEAPPEEAAEPTIERKSFFLKDLFTKIIFPDQFLARPTAGVRKRTRLLKLATVAASLAFLALCTFMSTVSFAGNSALLWSAGNAGKKVRELEKEKPTALQDNLLALDDLRDELQSLDSDDQSGPNITKRFFLYRGGQINADLRRVYFSRINTFFIVPMQKKMQQDLVAMRDMPEKKMSDHDRMFDLHRAYQMLAQNDDAATLEKGQRGALAVDVEVVKRVLDTKRYWLAGPEASGGVTPEIEALSKKQLEFLLTQLDRDDAWRYKPDKELIDRINRYLSGAVWMTESYNDIVNTGKGNYSKISRDYLLQSDGKKYLEIKDATGEFSFSQLYSQDIWNRYVSVAIKEKSQSLSKKFEELRKNVPAADIEKQLIEVYRKDYERNWTDLVKNMRVGKFANVEDAATRLRVLCGPESPVYEFFKDVADQQVLTVGPNEVYNRSAIEIKVVDELLKKIVDLQVALDTFYRAANEGSRFTGDESAGRLVELVAAFDKVNTEMGKTLDRVSTDTRERERISDVFKQLTGNAAEAVRSDCLIEANKLWLDKVYTPFKNEFAEKFPFKEDATTAVPIAAFSKMFNPTVTGTQAGTIAKTVKLLQDLNKQKVNGEQLLKIAPEFFRDTEPAGRITQALYPADSTTISVPFKCTLKQRGIVSNLVLTIGGKDKDDTKDIYSNPTRTYQFTWKEGNPGAKLELFAGTNESKVGSGDAKNLSFAKDEWGTIRLFYNGTAKTTNDLTYTFLWKGFVGLMGKPTELEGEIELTANDKINPFRKGFFALFKCPQKVGP